MMNEVVQFSAGHEDLIHDVAYDFYGKRLVTCSSDQKLKVWDMDEDKGNWACNDSWKGHDSSILKVAWAHPEYGQVFASCSFDRTVRVWEEQDQEAKLGGRRWSEKARLADSKGPVQDLEFAPTHLGLKLATAASDGVLRIYEAMDVVQLGQWTLMDEIEIASLGAIGSMESANIGSVVDGIMTRNQSNTAAATSGGSTNAGGGGGLAGSGGAGAGVGGLGGGGAVTSHYCLSWCPSRFQPQMLLIGCGRENVAKVFRIDAHGRWSPGEQLLGHGDVVTSVAWAPNMGRSYQLLATACRDGHVRIFRLSGGGNGALPGGGDGGSSAGGGGPWQTAGAKKSTAAAGRFHVELLADFSDHGTEVWRVEWNVTGTILSSSGDDGKVRLWKSSYMGEWRCMSIISAESADVAMR
ncbi:epoxide hydrolase, soluble (sEH) [Geranomyces variabilis]|nr:epoxide hydrolase, soluble (sEH) [Geranomyces variabilis]